MSGFRLFLGLPIAALITAGLFMVMNGMITSDVTLEKERKIERFVINARTETPPGPADPINPVNPDLPDAPPPVDLFPKNKGETVPTVFGGKPKKGGPIEGKIIDFPKILSPIVRIEPTFPDRCASRGLEGSVLVEFDITAEGAVINPRIISSVNRCFNRAVISAVTRWRYSPPGKMVRGQKTTLTFRLAQ